MPNHLHKTAVIDIGSNSVRLVIYDALKRVPVPLFNEKILCGLACDLEKTGQLYPEGVVLAEQALARFIALSRGAGVQSPHVFATSAVRDAEDGDAFLASLKKKYHVAPTLLSEKEEARFAALGVAASVHHPEGIVGDLGGGSLELIHINGYKMEGGLSFPIGPLRMPKLSSETYKLLMKEIDDAIGKLPLLRKLEGKHFYAVGGGFRTLAKMHMQKTHYPLKVLHNYTVSAEKLLPFLRTLSTLPTKEISKLPGSSKKRSEMLGYTALLLERVIKHGDPDAVVFSADGAREGFLFDRLPKETAAQDPLIASAEDVIFRSNRSPEYGHELMRWMDDLCAMPKEAKSEKRLRLAAALLSEIACYDHNEYRAELAFRKVIDAPLVGLTHEERAFLAMTLFYRYQTSPDPTITGKVQSLLSRKEIVQAKTWGLMMRVARNISGGSCGLLPHTPLTLKGKKLLLSFDPAHSNLMGEMVEKRLEKLANHMEVEARVAFHAMESGI